MAEVVAVDTLAPNMAVVEAAVDTLLQNMAVAAVGRLDPWERSRQVAVDTSQWKNRKVAEAQCRRA